MPETYLSDRQVASRYNVHKSTPWRWADDAGNCFPKPIALSSGCTRWKLSAIVAWEESKSEAA